MAPGEVVALLGPNGAGKTTVLRAIAGLVPLDAGRVVLDGRLLDDPATGTWVPTERRPIGYVFQDYLLFPHLSALDNVAFGLRSRGTPKAEARRRAAAWLDRVGLGGVGATKPGALSGGQAQRVALARALATEPRLLLLDEPLAALDAQTRVLMRGELRRTLASFEGIRLLVTHDPVEAMVLADRLVVVEEGRVVQTGTPVDVSRQPRSDYVAELVGLNLFRGLADGVSVRLAPGFDLTTATAATGDVFVAVRPNAVAIHTAPPGGSPRNVWAGVVEAVERRGEQVRVRVKGPIPLVAEVTPAAVAELGLDPGAAVWVGRQGHGDDGLRPGPVTRPAPARPQ